MSERGGGGGRVGVAQVVCGVGRLVGGGGWKGRRTAAARGRSFTVRSRRRSSTSTTSANLHLFLRHLAIRVHHLVLRLSALLNGLGSHHRRRWRRRSDAKVRRWSNQLRSGERRAIRDVADERRPREVGRVRRERLAWHDGDGSEGLLLWAGEGVGGGEDGVERLVRERRARACLLHVVVGGRKSATEALIADRRLGGRRGRRTTSRSGRGIVARSARGPTARGGRKTRRWRRSEVFIR